MGNKLSCINKDSINKILQKNNELNEEDFLNFNNNDNISTNSIEKPLNIRMKTTVRPANCYCLCC